MQDSKSNNYNSKIAREVDGAECKIQGFLYQKDIFEEMIKADLNDNDPHLDSELKLNIQTNSFNNHKNQQTIELKENLL